MAPQRDEIFKQNVNDCVQHIILQKFTNFHAILSWNFRIFAMRWWPRFFCATLYTETGGASYTSDGRMPEVVRERVPVKEKDRLNGVSIKWWFRKQISMQFQIREIL